jgi:hypothetical protein
MRSMLVMSLALLPPLAASLWMRLQLHLAEQDLGARTGLEGASLED